MLYPQLFISIIVSGLVVAHGGPEALEALESLRLKERADYATAVNVASNTALRLLRRSTYIETAAALLQTLAPGVTSRLIGDYYIGTNGIGHVNYRQTVHGLDIENADFNVNIAPDGSVFSYGNSFYVGELPSANPIDKRSFSSPTDALTVAHKMLRLPPSEATVAESNAETESYTIKGTFNSFADPEARLVYFVKPDGNLALTWKIDTRTPGDWFVSYVDAQTDAGVVGLANHVSHATYEVFPWGLNDPTEGSRKVVRDPQDTKASPSGWHTSANSTQFGNNCNAGSVPYASTGRVYYVENATLTFEFPWNQNADPRDFQDAAITQIFYTVNMYHDLLYILGFTPAAGNMQVDNFGEGGKGDDELEIYIQHFSGKNNGNFHQTADGLSPRMEMYLFNHTNPERDVAFDNGFVIHEYTHGLSGRLTGGPANPNCLDAYEPDGMAEGWSDLYAAAITLKAEDTRDTAEYGFAAWPLGIETAPKTARIAMYSTRTEVNNLTYSSANNRVKPHEVGTVWATMLYEVLWNLIDKYGKNDAERPDMVNGVPTDGKYLTLKILLDAMALQPCNPTFVQARDAILEADSVLTGGRNKCEIWKGFAKRGLGEGAVFNATNRVDNFVLPAGVC